MKIGNCLLFVIYHFDFCLSLKATPRRVLFLHFDFIYVGMAGIEPATSSLSEKRSTSELHTQVKKVIIF